MKRSTFILIAFLAGMLASLVSCTKSNDITRNEVSTVPDQSKIEFSVYNSVKTYTQVVASAQQITGVRVYTFVGTKNPVAENVFTLTFMTDSLRPGTYNVNTGVVDFREGSTVISNVSSTNFTVTIASNVNGLVNGTFAGTMYDHTTGRNCDFVQGKIENIQLSYR